jgi:hypothetical protein
MVASCEIAISLRASLFLQGDRASLTVTLIPKPYNCLYSLRQSRSLSGKVTVFRRSTERASLEKKPSTRLSQEPCLERK